MVNWIDDNDCTACGACHNICPKNAINMVSDRCGFAHPRINSKLCIDCGLCKSVCPISTPASSNGNSANPDVYAAWSLNEDTRYKSTSGGVFSELARRIFSMGGFIVGAVYDENHMVHHEIVSDEEGLRRVRQSKYVQSDIKNIYKKIKELLDSEQIVAFCGSPCQVAGLYSFLKKRYEKLYTIDFICRGSNSPKAYRKWLDMLENQYHSKVTRVWFKNKELGWNRFSTRVDFENGKKYRKDRYTDLFMRGYLEKNLYIRPCCGNCHFKSMPRVADITLADFWGIDKKLDADKGTSMVIVNNNKGASLVNQIRSQIFIAKRNLEEAGGGNGMMDRSAWISKWSKTFLLSLDEYRFDKAFNKLMRKLEYHKFLAKIRNRFHKS